MHPPFEARGRCFRCYRPQSSCMCSHLRPITTQTKFVILMHPKEFRKIKNGTGHFTHLSLPHSERHIGIDFTDHDGVNRWINDPQHCCYLLYPSPESIPLNVQGIAQQGKTSVIFVLDGTWDGAKKMLRLSRNLQGLPRISFEQDKGSRFEIKTQPEAYCLSTMESVQCVLALLNKHGDETITEEALAHFLDPFDAMIDYQKSCIDQSGCSVKNAVRYKQPRRGKPTT